MPDAPTPPSTAPDLDADAVDAAASVMYDRVKTVETMTFDIAYPSEQDDFRRVARAMVTAYLTASPLLSAPAPDLDAIREALRAAELDRPCDLYPEDSEYNCIADPVVNGEVCGPCAIRALMSALDEANRQIAGNAWFRTGHPLTEQAIIRLNGLREYGPDMTITDSNAILDRLEDLVRMLGFDAEHANDILAETMSALDEERRQRRLLRDALQYVADAHAHWNPDTDDCDTCRVCIGALEADDGAQ